MNEWDPTVVVAAVASSVGAIAAVIAAIAAVIGLRKPKLKVVDMGLTGHTQSNFIGEVKRQQDDYEGEEPMYVLTISVANTGKVVASRVSGTILILGALEPLNFPGYTHTRIRFPLTGGVGIKVIDVPALDEHRAPPEYTKEALRLEIPVLIDDYDGSTPESMRKSMKQRIHIAYRLLPERGKLIEGEWLLKMRGGHPGEDDVPHDHGPLPKSKRELQFPNLDSR